MSRKKVQEGKKQQTSALFAIVPRLLATALPAPPHPTCAWCTSDRPSPLLAPPCLACRLLTAPPHPPVLGARLIVLPYRFSCPALLATCSLPFFDNLCPAHVRLSFPVACPFACPALPAPACRLYSSVPNRRSSRTIPFMSAARPSPSSRCTACPTTPLPTSVVPRSTAPWPSQPPFDPYRPSLLITCCLSPVARSAALPAQSTVVQFRPSRQLSRLNSPSCMCYHGCRKYCLV